MKPVLTRMLTGFGWLVFGAGLCLYFSFLKRSCVFHFVFLTVLMMLPKRLLNKCTNESWSFNSKFTIIDFHIHSITRNEYLEFVLAYTYGTSMIDDNRYFVIELLPSISISGQLQCLDSSGRYFRTKLYSILSQLCFLLLT